MKEEITIIKSAQLAITQVGNGFLVQVGYLNPDRGYLLPPVESQQVFQSKAEMFKFLSNHFEYSNANVIESDKIS